jgi:flavin reductase (DIM6/NTAB) family NADH-FMN oxidoreductase RutF
VTALGPRDGVAKLTRVAEVATAEDAGLMPPPGSEGVKRVAKRAGSVTYPAITARGTHALDHVTTSARHAIEQPTGVARLTPRSATAERAARELRSVMGRFATGVTVVTTVHRETIHGMTANAFLSVSLRPPLVLVSLGRCRMSEMLPRTGHYGISVLASDQEDFAAHFAGQRVSPVEPSFAFHEDLPLLDGALAHVGCKVVDVHPAGDHVLWIGEVEHLWHRDGEPLLFYTGRFGTLADVSQRANA